MKTTTLQVPTFKIPALQEHVAKLNKKATKLGVNGITLTLGEVTTVRVKTEQNKKGSLVECQEVTIEGDDIKLAGWQLLGVLDHTTGATIVKVVPGQAVPTQYFTASCFCDHCSTQRRRNETFIVKHDDGNIKQIGRQCLKDFLGTDPHARLWMYETIASLVDELQNNDEAFGGLGGAPWIEDVEEIITVALAWTSKHGYVSQKMAAEHEFLQTTKSIVMDYLFGNNSQKEINELREEINELREAAGISEKVSKIIEWAQAKVDAEQTSEFWHNIGVFLQTKSVATKFFGYLVCLPTLYAKEMDELAERAKEVRVNEHAGVLGARGAFNNLKVVRTYKSEGFYGVTTIVTFNDAEGRTFVWFASGSHDYETGETFNVKATVKDHSEYKGTKQTIITRAKLTSI